MLMFLFTALLVSGAAIWFVVRRSPVPVPIGNGPVAPEADYAQASSPGYGVNRQASAGLAEAEADARRWVDRLGSGITALEGMNDEGDAAVRRSVSEAVERHAASRRELAEAYTLGQVRRSGHTAVEGMYHLRSARLALGLDPGPELP